MLPRKFGFVMQSTRRTADRLSQVATPQESAQRLREVLDEYRRMVELEADYVQNAAGVAQAVRLSGDGSCRGGV